MIYTGLPYDTQQLTVVQEEGAIVDMSQLDFGSYTDEDPIEVAMTYLKNTDFQKIVLDTSKLDYNSRARLAEMYMFGRWSFFQNELMQTAMHVLAAAVEKQDVNVEGSFFSYDECVKFIASHEDCVLELMSVLKSSQLFLLSRAKLFAEASIDVEHAVTRCKLKNLANIVSAVDLDSLWLKLHSMEEVPLKFYDNLFNMDAHELFAAIMPTFTGFIIDSISHANT